MIEIEYEYTHEFTFDSHVFFQVEVRVPVQFCKDNGEWYIHNYQTWEMCIQGLESPGVRHWYPVDEVYIFRLIESQVLDHLTAGKEDDKIWDKFNQGMGR